MGEDLVEVRQGDLVFPVRRAGPGDGECVIFLHGFPQTSAMWTPYLAHLAAAGMHAVAPDQRGYAATARPPGVGSYTVDLLVADVVGIANGLGFDRFHLVGHDWGGLVGWALASAHPDRVRSLTSVSTPHPRAWKFALRQGGQLARSWYMALFQVPRLPERLLTARHGALLRGSLRRSGLPEVHADAYTRAMLQPEAMTAVINPYRALRARGVLTVGRITVPTLYVWGPGDTALGPVAARATAREVDGPYRLVVLDGASHWIPETRVEELCSLVVDHIHGAAPARA